MQIWKTWNLLAVQFVTKLSTSLGYKLHCYKLQVLNHAINHLVCDDQICKGIPRNFWCSLMMFRCVLQLQYVFWAHFFKNSGWKSWIKTNMATNLPRRFGDLVSLFFKLLENYLTDFEKNGVQYFKLGIN